MWVLMFFQFVNNNLDHYQIGQYATEEECRVEEERATVLVTTRNISLYCFEVK